MDPNLVEELKKMFSNDPFAKQLGIELIEFSPGYAKVRMKVENSHLNFFGFVHGGAIFSLLDQAFAAASNSHNYSSVAISMSVNFINAPKKEATLWAEAKEVDKSRKLGLYEMTVRDDEGALICRCDGRVYRIGKPFIGDGGA